MRKSTQILLTVFTCLIIVVSAWADESLVASHRVDSYAGGQNVSVRNTITYSGSLTALGFRVTLPKEWSFVSAYSANMPDVTPKLGAAGILEFAWITPPASPFVFSYEVLATEGESGSKEINASVLYRRLGKELTEAVQPNPLLINQ